MRVGNLRLLSLGIRSLGFLSFHVGWSRQSVVAVDRGMVEEMLRSFGLGMGMWELVEMSFQYGDDSRGMG